MHLCIFISSTAPGCSLSQYLPKLVSLCEYIICAEPLSAQDLEQIPHEFPIHTLNLSPTDLRGTKVLLAAEKAKYNKCTHILHLELQEDIDALLEDVKTVLATAQKHLEAITLGSRDFSQKCPFRMRFERFMSSFWLRVQTGAHIRDTHCALRIYPLGFFDFARIQEKGYAFEPEALVRASWADYPLQEVLVSMPSPHTWKGPKFKDYTKLIALNVRLTMRALVPLPFKRRNAQQQEPISLKEPLRSLRRLMDDPYNRANPKELARSAAMAIAVLTVPAPIIQSVALLLFIGWFRLNRLCALAMIPFTWPPFLPAMAILIGYRVRHGHWLTEFNVQTLGYEAGQRLWEWVIGSLILTPIFALTAGCVVGSLALLVAKKK